MWGQRWTTKVRFDFFYWWWWWRCWRDNDDKIKGKKSQVPDRYQTGGGPGCWWGSLFNIINLNFSFSFLTNFFMKIFPVSFEEKNLNFWWQTFYLFWLISMLHFAIGSHCFTIKALRVSFPHSSIKVDSEFKVSSIKPNFWKVPFTIQVKIWDHKQKLIIKPAHWER